MSGSPLGAYRGLGARVHLHTALRWATAPVAELVAELPERGEVLDVGCGHALLALHLATRSPEVTVSGVDVDTVKLAAARRAVSASGLDGRVRLAEVDVGWLPAPGSCDAAVVSDVLYLLGAERAGELLEALAVAVRPGGTVVVQDTDPTCGWRSRLAAVQEQISVRLLGLTAGGRVEFLEPGEVVSRLRGAGLDVAPPRPTRRPHPQFVVVARRP